MEIWKFRRIDELTHTLMCEINDTNMYYKGNAIYHTGNAPPSIVPTDTIEQSASFNYINLGANALVVRRNTLNVALFQASGVVGMNGKLSVGSLEIDGVSILASFINNSIKIYEVPMINAGPVWVKLGTLTTAVDAAFEIIGSNGYITLKQHLLQITVLMSTSILVTSIKAQRSPVAQISEQKQLQLA